MEARGLAFFLLLLGAVVAKKHDIYSGYSVFKINIGDSSQQDLLESLVAPLGLDTWQHGLAGRRDAVVMVGPEHKTALQAELDQAGVQYSVVTSNVAEMLKQKDEELTSWRQARRAAGQRIVPFEDYPRYDEAMVYLQYLAATYPNEVTLVNAGQSYEGRDILYLKVSSSNFEDESKPIYFLDATIHAREWVTTPVSLYVLHQLLEVRAQGEEDLLSGTDWIVLPIVNPDGYEYSLTDDYLWRRTRSVNLTISTTCVGADGNRNFDYQFNTYGVSTSPCSDTYPGPFAFSEVETQYVRDIILEHVNRMQVYMNIHSFGNYILFGFDDVMAPNTVQLHHLGATMGAAIDVHKLPGDTFYLVGNGGLVLYPASGNAQDWAQSVGVTFAYTLELPDFNYWFWPPPSYISQINEETWHGIVASARLAKIYFDADRA